MFLGCNFSALFPRSTWTNLLSCRGIPPFQSPGPTTRLSLASVVGQTERAPLRTPSLAERRMERARAHRETSAMHRGTPRTCRAHAAHMQRTCRAHAAHMPRTCRATVNDDSADDYASWQDRTWQGLGGPHFTPVARASPLLLPRQSPCRSGDESVYVPCLSRGHLGEAWWAWPSGLFVCYPVVRRQACCPTSSQ